MTRREEINAVSQYGAAMGRRDYGAAASAEPINLAVRFIPLDSGGYDSGGAYWGTGQPLFIVESDDSEISRFFRADNMESALSQVRAYFPAATVAIDADGLDDFARAFVECALWAESDNSDESGGRQLSDEFGLGDVAPETIATMAADCADFQKANEALLQAAYSARDSYTAENAGHDFFLTRNRHGAGFWDRGLGEIGNKLSEAARAYGEFSLWVDRDEAGLGVVRHG